MSNLIKSGFVAFSQDNTLVIDANQSKIIKALGEASEEMTATSQDTMEEALAEALIHDAELEGVDFGEDLLTMDTAEIPHLSESSGEIQQVADEVVKSAKEEAESIINRAHDEAEQMRAAAYDEAEQIKQQAQETGYQNGYEEGMTTAKQELEEQMNELAQQKNEMENEFQKMESMLIQNTEQQMVDLLCQLIPSVTGVVVEEQRDVLLYMINNAMQDLDNSNKFVVRVSLDDYEMLAERQEEIYGALNPNVELEIFQDSKLAPLQCRIETDNGIVDVSLDVQLHNLITALKLMAKGKE